MYVQSRDQTCSWVETWRGGEIRRAGLEPRRGGAWIKCRAARKREWLFINKLLYSDTENRVAWKSKYSVTMNISTTFSVINIMNIRIPTKLKWIITNYASGKRTRCRCSMCMKHFIGHYNTTASNESTLGRRIMFIKLFWNSDKHIVRNIEEIERYQRERDQRER